MRRNIDQSELNQPLSKQALAHLASCGDCREFRDERARLRELVGSLEPVTAPADFDVRLRARIAAERQSKGRRPFFAVFALGRPATAVAALVITCVALAVWYAERNRNQIPTITSASGPARQNTPANDESREAGKSTTPTIAVGSNAIATPNSAQEAFTIHPRIFASRGTERKANQPIPTNSTENLSRDFNVRPASSIKQSDTKAGEVSLSAPFKPLVVSLEDDRGATRKISLPPISFGSQRLVDKLTSTNSRFW